MFTNSRKSNFACWAETFYIAAFSTSENNCSKIHIPKKKVTFMIVELPFTQWWHGDIDTCCTPFFVWQLRNKDFFFLLVSSTPPPPPPHHHKVERHWGTDPTPCHNGFLPLFCLSAGPPPQCKDLPLACPHPQLLKSWCHPSILIPNT